jgi:hypothetical protein
MCILAQKSWLNVRYSVVTRCCFHVLKARRVESCEHSASRMRMTPAPNATTIAPHSTLGDGNACRPTSNATGGPAPASRLSRASELACRSARGPRGPAAPAPHHPRHPRPHRHTSRRLASQTMGSRPHSFWSCPCHAASRGEDSECVLPRLCRRRVLTTLTCSCFSVSRRTGRPSARLHASNRQDRSRSPRRHISSSLPLHVSPSPSLPAAVHLSHNFRLQNRYARQQWDTLTQAKSRILEFVWSQAPVSAGIRLAAVKFMQRVILVQTRGVADPRVRFLAYTFSEC